MTKFTVDRDAIVAAMTRANLVIEMRTTIPILSHVVILATSTSIMIAATDLDRHISESVPADIAEPGSLTLPAKAFLQIVRAAPKKAAITVAVGGGDYKISVSYGNSTASLGGLAPEDFPKPSDKTRDTKFCLSPADFRSLFSRVAYAISTEETRYYLNGIYLHFPDVSMGPAGSIRAVATDGHRMGMASVPAPNGSETLPGVIIPQRTVKTLRTLADKAKRCIKIEVGREQLRFDIDGAVVLSKAIDGTFPDYQRVIPSGTKYRVTFNRAEMIAGLKSVSGILDRNHGGVEFVIDNKTITLNAKTPEAQSSETVSCESRKSGLSIGFNYRYLLDTLAAMSGEAVRLDMVSAADPVILHDLSDEAALHVLMPMRVA